MLKLFVSDKDATTGSIPISWCIDDETLLYLRDKGAKKPNVVIYITPEEMPHQIYIVVTPFKNMMVYVPLRFKGKNRIFGRVMFSKSYFYSHDDIVYWDLPPDKEENKEEKDGPTKILVKGYEIGSEKFERYEKTSTGTYLTINVPEECFAKEPPKWEQAWVNAMFRQRPQDQCEYRRRRLWAYSIQPIIVLFLMILRLIPTLVAFLFAARNFSFKHLFSPFALDLDDAKEMFSEGLLFVRKDQTSLLKTYCMFPLTPIISFPIIGVAVLCLIGKISVVGIGMTILYILGTFFGIVLLVLLVFFIVYVVMSQLDKIPTWYDDQSEIEAIVCDGRSVPTKISKLPQKKRTVYLRYQAVKNKVCKPFAG